MAKEKRSKSKTNSDKNKKKSTKSKFPSSDNISKSKLTSEKVLTGSRANVTGRHIVVFKDQGRSVSENENMLRQIAGIRDLAKSSDYDFTPLSSNEIDNHGGGYYTQLGIAVIAANQDLNQLRTTANDTNGPIMSIEPEYIAYHQSALEKRVSLQYLRGYRDGISDLVDKISMEDSPEELLQASGREVFQDDMEFTWGLRAIGVDTSRYTGLGCRIAVLDTGIDLEHPDFANRSIISQSFSGQPVQDTHGHGTHCCGTACGPARPESGVRRYGVAPDAQLFVGKVFDNSPPPFGPAATTGDVVAGIEWAMKNECQIVSLSLGVEIDEQISQYRIPIRRALQAGTLVVAAAGNNANRPGHPKFDSHKLPTKGFVESPANADNSMAIAAVDRKLRLAAFSARSSQTTVPGGNIDLAAPGVSVFSSVPSSRGTHASFNGTSMATPHVAGIAALIHQATGDVGRRLFERLKQTTQSLNIDPKDVGSGLVRAPQ